MYRLQILVTNQHHLTQNVHLKIPFLDSSNLFFVISFHLEKNTLWNRAVQCDKNTVPLFVSISSPYPYLSWPIIGWCYQSEYPHNAWRMEEGDWQTLECYINMRCNFILLCNGKYTKDKCFKNFCGHTNIGFLNYKVHLNATLHLLVAFAVHWMCHEVSVPVLNSDRSSSS